MLLDYIGLGFKAGLEVHHQLNTERKLFCHCPVNLTNRRHDAEVLRHMRPTLSELGEYDGTALMEFKTKKEVLYQIYGDINCTYEMDDTPPFMVNEKALDIAIAIAQTFNMSLVDEVHITRKQYLDGSIPTGFQRTAIMGVGGGFEMSNRTIGILHMSVEEDSCREVSDKGHRIVFKADRLGIPLVEVVTAPDFQTPEEAGLGAEAIRRALWNLGMVRRGPGSVRHDVNCSIRGGTRIEIKGVPRIGDIPRLLHNETWRQKALLEIMATLRSRGVTADTIQQRIADVTRLLRNVDNSALANQRGNRIVAVRLNGFGGLLTWQTQEHTVFADEFAGRIRVIACLDQMPNMLHPDSPDAMNINSGIWRKIRNRLDATHHDAIFLVYGPDEDLETAVSEIYIRAREATRGIPPETRQALKNGCNDFERILPGPDRMYPDTDHPPLPLSEERIHSIAHQLPEQPWIRERRYQEIKVPQDVIRSLAISEYAPLFDRLSMTFPESAKRQAEILGRMIPFLARKNIPVHNLTEQRFEELFMCWQDGLFFREGFKSLLLYMAENPNQKCIQCLQKTGMTPATDDDINNVIQKAAKQMNSRTFCHLEQQLNWLMGEAMKSLKGRAHGRELSIRIRDTLEKKREQT
ncbi:Glu-tRNA(Gln) amidotransferase subunit GatE [bacterium]|nr:Glu-tRNA(Gln) amidotransferase subunit GatE [candidate division CSSED10-310 bacterium]